MVKFRIVFAVLIVAAVTLPIAQVYAMKQMNNQDGKGHEEETKEAFTEVEADVEALVASNDLVDSGFERNGTQSLVSEGTSAQALAFEEVHVGKRKKDDETAFEVLREEKRLFCCEESVLRRKIHNKALLNEWLRKAVLKRDRDEIRRLLAEGADVNAQYNSHGTALLRVHEDEIVHKLLQAGADSTIPYRKEGMTLLKSVFDHNIINILLEAGVDVNAREDFGLTVLVSAILEGRKEKAILLMWAGAFFEEIICVKAEDGKTYIRENHSKLWFQTDKKLMRMLEQVQEKIVAHFQHEVTNLIITSAPDFYVGELWGKVPQVVKDIVGDYITEPFKPYRFTRCYKYGNEICYYEITVFKPFDWTFERLRRVQEQIEARQAAAIKVKKNRCLIS